MRRHGTALLLALFALGGLVAPAAGQDSRTVDALPERGLLSLGFEAGFDHGLDPVAGTGFTGGMVIRYGLTSRTNPIVGLQSGAYYTRGAGTLENATGTTNELDMDYLDVPLLVVASIPTEGAIAPRLYGGPMLRIQVACSESLVGSDGFRFQSPSSRACDDQEVTSDPDLTWDSGTDAAVLLGGGIDFAVGPGAGTVDVRFRVGLGDLNDADVAGARSVSGHGVSLRAGYIFSTP